MTASTRFRTATVTSHRAIVTVEVRDPDGNYLTTLRPSAGSVTANRTAAIRRTCSLTIPNPGGGLTPRTFRDVLHPLSGNELHLWRGIDFLDGTTEVHPLGVLPITAANPGRGAEGVTLEVSGQDRAENVAGRTLAVPKFYPGGSLAEVTAALLGFLWPQITLDLTDFGPVVNSGAIPNAADGWAFVRKMHADHGELLAFDADGVCRNRQIIDPSTLDPEWTYGPTGARAVLSVQQPISRQDIRTGVVVRVENPLNGEVYTGQAWDLNPDSPTYSEGPLGRRPEQYDAPTIGSDEAAAESARTRLIELAGRSDPVDVSIVPNAALDVGTVNAFHVGTDATATKVLLDQSTMPLTVSGEQSLIGLTTLPLDAAA